MPGTSRASLGGYCYHVIICGNERQDVFHKEGDFAAFANLIGDASERIPMRVLSACVMTNHFHLVLWPRNDGDLSRWVQWFLTSHVRRYHWHYDSSDHVWQGDSMRFQFRRMNTVTLYFTLSNVILCERIWSDGPKTGNGRVPDCGFRELVLIGFIADQSLEGNPGFSR